MDRRQLENYISETYNAKADHPWAKYPNFTVFRHANNQKWFALVMDVSKAKLGAPGDGTLDVVNLKCSPLMIGSLLSEKGFFPAYHMNKESWLTVSLDGSVEDEKLKLLLDMSYESTAAKVDNRQKAP